LVTFSACGQPESEPGTTPDSTTTDQTTQAESPDAGTTPSTEQEDSTAQTETPPAPAETEEPTNSGPGLAIGTKAPAFALPDQHGETRTLDELLKGGKVALVFYRSADW
jgi:hypothetical protein